MRILYTLFLVAVFLIGNAQAQEPIIGPLKNNPALQLENWSTTPELVEAAAPPSQTLDCTNPNPGIYIDGDSALVESGNSLIICPDLFRFDTATCKNCNDLMLGQLDSTLNNCFFYTSNSGITLDRETLVLERCDTNNVCEDVNIEIIIKRAGQTIVELPTNMREQSSQVLCASNLNFPGDLMSGQILPCFNPEIGSAIQNRPQVECFTFQANRLAIADTLCLELSDQYCVIDTFLFPVQIEGDTLDLPFTDDFSYEGNQVNQTLWLSNTIFVNNTLAFEPPSVGVATFDGLDETGSPYGGGLGISDVLTSNYLDLEGESNVILSFYLQSKGLGYQPIGANMILEYKNIDGSWDEIKTVVDTFRVSQNDSPPFLYYEFPVEGTEYLYNGFQFRFAAESARVGISDLWHLDYVRLESNRLEDVRTIDDLAISTFSFSLLDRYSSMPVKQYLVNPQEETVSDFSITLFNHENQQQAVTQNDLKVRKSNEVAVLHDAFIDVNGRNLASLEYLTISETIGFRSDLAQDLDNALDANTPTNLISTLAIRTDNQDQDLSFARRNDSISVSTSLDNFYAYDDGTAELIATSSSSGTILAVAFELNTADSLRAIKLHFPHFNNDRNVRFNLYVWGENLEDGPIHEERFLSQLFTSEVFDTIQGFTTYALKDEDGSLKPIGLPAGKFHVGWEQLSSSKDPVVVGFDRNSNKAAGNQFVNRGAWRSLEDAGVPSGAIMIRPIFGDRVVYSTSTRDIDQRIVGPKVFPNPSQGLINFDLPTNYQFEDFQLRVMDATGRLIYQGDLQPSLSLTDFGKGIFFLEMRDLNSGQRFFEKIMVLK